MQKYNLDLSKYKKIIVGEGSSDAHFFESFCLANGISGFDFTYTGKIGGSDAPSGFNAFKKFLPNLSYLAGFEQLTDLVLACDSTDNSDKRLKELQKQVKDANKELENPVFDDDLSANVISKKPPLRVHALFVPRKEKGGLETICVNLARDHWNQKVTDSGRMIETWVNEFADKACEGWTTEKRDKLRLQAFMSAAWKHQPELNFSQLFQITKQKIVPLTGPALSDIKEFLEEISRL